MATTTRSRATSLLALLSVVFLLATACSDDGGDDASTETTVAASEDGATTTTAPADAEPPSESPAAGLRSDLSGLLAEQVYLTAMTVKVGVGGPSDAPLPAAYEVAALEGTDDLGNIIGGAYGSGAGNDVVAALNDHRQAIVAYGLDGGPAGAVDETRSAVVDALGAADEEADFSGVEDALAARDASLVAAVDQLTGGQPAAAADLQAAGEEASEVGLDLAEIIVEHQSIEGEIDSPEATLRADLTTLMQESTLLTGLDLLEIVEAGGGPSGTDTRATIDANSTALGQTIEPDSASAAEEFARLWSGHIDQFEAYATALVNDDAQGIEDAHEAIIDFRDEVGAVLADSYPGFTPHQVAEILVDHTDSLFAVADALVSEAGDLAADVEESSQVSDTPSEAPALLRDAALDARLAARSLTLGITAPEASNEAEAATTTTAA